MHPTVYWQVRAEVVEHYIRQNIRRAPHGDDDRPIKNSTPVTQKE